MGTSDRYSIGVDLGGTNLRVAVYRESSSGGSGIIDSIALPTRLAAGREVVANDMSEAIDQLARRHCTEENFAGLGIGTPGPLELPEGILRNPPNLPGWDGFNFREAIERRVKMPALIESDANLAAFAEFHLGSGRSYGVSSLCMLTLGTGVGNGIVLNGKIWDGNNGMAGEAGHNTVFSDGDACGCGSRGCLEVYASATAVRRMAESLAPQVSLEGESGEGESMFTARRIAELAMQGNASAIAIFERVGTALGIGLGALVNTLNLPLYVIGGGLSGGWELFAPRMLEELSLRSYVYRLTRPSSEEAKYRSPRKTHVIQAELGSDAGILGACLLPLMKPGKET